MLIEQRDQTRPDWIVEDVSHDVGRLFVAPQPAIVIPILPESGAVLAHKPKASLLFERRDEAAEIYLERRSFNEQVQVIGHEAVRRNCEPVTGRGLQKPRSSDVHSSRFSEPTRAVRGAQSEEISLKSDVRDVGESPRSA